MVVVTVGTTEAEVGVTMVLAWPGAITVGRGDATVVGINMLYCGVVWVHCVFVVVCVRVLATLTVGFHHHYCPMSHRRLAFRDSVLGKQISRDCSLIDFCFVMLHD